MKDKRIIVCVHDVSPKHADRLRRIDTFLCDLGLRGRYAMLVVPNFWNEWPMEQDTEFVEWLRARSDEGVEMILHGFFHRDDTEHSGAMARMKSTALTASEGEFLGLSYDEAVRRITAGRELFRELLGLDLDGFVAPAWLYSEGTERALRDLSFRFAEDHMKVWSPVTGRVVHRSPVVGYASRDKRRIASSLVWSRSASTLLRPMPIVRHAIHPHDFDVDLLVTEIRRSLQDFLAKREPMFYRELVGDAA